jgi:hypothetical protein
MHCTSSFDPSTSAMFLWLSYFGTELPVTCPGIGPDRDIGQRLLGFCFSHPSAQPPSGRRPVRRGPVTAPRMGTPICFWVGRTEWCGQDFGSRMSMPKGGRSLRMGWNSPRDFAASMAALRVGACATSRSRAKDRASHSPIGASLRTPVRSSRAVLPCICFGTPRYEDRLVSGKHQ